MPMLRARDPSRPAAPDVELRYRVTTQDDWTLAEGTVPQSRPHDLTVELLRGVLTHWARTARPAAQVGSELAVRWDEERPGVGVDPDVYLVDPAPPEGDEVSSLRLWEPGHHAPLVAIEVVSRGHPTKDYAVAPAKYAVSGTRELWVFDPALAGPTAYGGPHRLQVWLRDPGGAWVRAYAGDGPVRSTALGCWLVPVARGARLRLADDADGRSLWPTAEEAERREKERATAETARATAETARAVAETQRATQERERALATQRELEARVAELEAALSRR